MVTLYWTVVQHHAGAGHRPARRWSARWGRGDQQPFRPIRGGPDL